MAKALMYLMFGCVVLAVALGVMHLFGLSLDLPLGANGAVYLGVVLGSALSLHRICESPNK